MLDIGLLHFKHTLWHCNKSTCRAIDAEEGAGRAGRQSLRWLIPCCNEPSTELNWKQMCRTNTAGEYKLNHSPVSARNLPDQITREIKKASESIPNVALLRWNFKIPPIFLERLNCCYILASRIAVSNVERLCMYLKSVRCKCKVARSKYFSYWDDR